MALQITQITNNNQNWDIKRRYRVNEVVNFSGNVYQNYTGGNSNPSLGVDWIFLKSTSNALSTQIDLEANGVDNFVDIGTTDKVTSFYYGSVLQAKDVWSQTGSTINFTFTPEAGSGTKNLQFN